MSLSIYIMSSFLMRYPILHELNILAACWISVDVWSNTSRCRIVLVYLSRTWCLYTWSCLDILIILLNSVNCSTVICSPTVEYLCSWEKPLVKPMAPGSILHHTSFKSILFLQSLLSIYIIKIPKIFILSYNLYRISLLQVAMKGLTTPLSR